MKKRRLFVISSLIFFLFVGVTTSVLAKKKVLIYTKNGKGFVHDNIANSVKVITQLCVNNNIEVYATDDPAHFTEQNLKQYSALIFSNTIFSNYSFDE